MIYIHVHINIYLFIIFIILIIFVIKCEPVLFWPKPKTEKYLIDKNIHVQICPTKYIV